MAGRRVLGVGGGSSNPYSSGGVTNNVIPKGDGSSKLADSLLTDNATTLTYTGTGGIVSPAYSSNTASVASAGQIRLASTDTLKFRNNAGGGDIAISKSGATASGLVADSLRLDGFGSVALADGAAGAASLNWTVGQGSNFGFYRKGSFVLALSASSDAADLILDGSTGSFKSITGGVFGWASSSSDATTLDTGISRTGAAGIAVGNGGAGDFTGTVKSAVVVGAGANGETWTRGYSMESLTLSTGGLTTQTTANLLPANSIIEAVVCRVTTTITTTTNWAVGDSTTTSRFSSANATLTANTTSVGLNHYSGAVTTLAAGPTQAAAAKVQITCTGSNPGAGVIRITVFWRTMVAPSS